VRPSDIVVDAPRFNRLLRIGQAHEPALVQALVPEPPVEALGERILNRLAGLNELKRDAARVCPLIECLAGELGTIVTDERRREAARYGQLIKHAHHALARQREVDFDRRRLAREVIDARECAKLPPVAQCVRDEVHAPPLVRCAWRREWHARHRDALALPPADVESFFPIDPLYELPIDDIAFAPQQHVEPPIAPARALRREGLQARTELRARRSARAIALARAREAGVPARAALGDVDG